MGRSIYDRFALNLNDIRARYNLAIGSADSEERLKDGYLCPITLDYFPDPKVKELSREHVPQEKLGGSILCLTRAKWNKGFGTYDNYAVERVKEIAKNRLSNKLHSKGGFHNGMTGRFELTPGPKPKITFISKACNPDNPKFSEFMLSMKNKGEFKINLKPSGQLTRLTKIAYLKNAYLILFSYFGYSTIFGEKGAYKMFSEVRNQLRNPEKNILPSLEFIGEFASESPLNGVYVISQGEERTVGVFYELVYDITVRVGVIFPSLSQTENSYFRCDQIYLNINYTKINESNKFYLLDETLAGVRADFVQLEY